MSIAGQTLDWLSDPANWQGPDGIASRVAEHLGYTALTIALASVVAVPLGLWTGHTGRWRRLATAGAGALRALPTLGLLTLLALRLGIGLTGPVIVLVILAVPPLLAGVDSGIAGVDRSTVDAARALGMTQWQVLALVEIPLALPLIVSGLRSAVLQVVATATVAAYVSLGGLGRFIIDGQQTHDYPQMLAGALLVVAVALVLDLLLGALQRLVTPAADAVVAPV